MPSLSAGTGELDSAPDSTAASNETVPPASVPRMGPFPLGGGGEDRQGQPHTPREAAMDVVEDQSCSDAAITTVVGGWTAHPPATPETANGAGTTG
jgi:hypothetical protein